MGRAIEELAARSGAGIGGLLNVTFGNAPELIIAVFALDAGLHEGVKASLVGSILGNILLVIGAAMLPLGLRRERQFFDRTASNARSLMLLLACVASPCPRFRTRGRRRAAQPSGDHDEDDHVGEDAWSVRRSVTVPALAGVALMSEILVRVVPEHCQPHHDRPPLRPPRPRRTRARGQPPRRAQCV